MKYFLLFPMAVFSLLVGCGSEKHEAQCDPPCSEYQRCDQGICRDQDCPEPCREGRVCFHGFCLRECDPNSGGGCARSETCCPNLRACVDTSNDFFNCGDCGYVCPELRSNFCDNGQCGCRHYMSNPCAEGWGCCDDGCKDLSNDAENCGVCGHSCGGLECVEGQCRCSHDEPCPTGQECCPDGCRDVSSDSLNCGRCGFACESSEDCCDGQCVNTFIEPAHCGQCGSSCAEGEQCCIGSCADTRVDPFNCGDCLVDCGAGGSCADGHCQ